MNERRIATRGIIYKNGKILAQQLVNKNDETPDYWCTPGGGLDFGETLEQGLSRELIEETGIKPEIGKLLFIQQYKDSKREYLEFFYHIKNVSDYEIIDLTSTTHGIAEIENVEFVDPKITNVLPNFLQEIDIKDYIVNDKPVFYHNKLN